MLRFIGSTIKTQVKTVLGKCNFSYKSSFPSTLSEKIKKMYSAVNVKEWYQTKIYNFIRNKAKQVIIGISNAYNAIKDPVSRKELIDKIKNTDYRSQEMIFLYMKIGVGYMGVLTIIAFLYMILRRTMFIGKFIVSIIISPFVFLK